MKIAVDIGHNARPFDTGAVGFESEDILVKQIGTRLIKLLENNNYPVVLVTPTKVSSVTDSLRQRCINANKANADLFISIHCNAFNSERANGVETLVFSKKSSVMQYADAVQSAMVNLGYTDRGVKEVPGLFVLKNTRMPAMLVECGFVTNKLDMTRFDADDFARAIFSGIHKRSAANKDDLNPDDPGLGIGTLFIKKPTVGKPSTEQSAFIPGHLKVPLPVGEYKDVKLICDEEGHYLVLIPFLTSNNQTYMRTYHWIWKGTEADPVCVFDTDND